MKELPSDTQLIRLVFTLIGVFLLFFIFPENTLSEPVDTLHLQLLWTYPINIVDMKLVDFNHDGIDEILVGFKSDSSRVGILDAVTHSMIWQSPAFHGAISTVAAGDRDNDGDLDIVAGGQRSDSAIGYIEVFDGPDFNSVHTLSGFDQKVLSSAISARSSDSLPQIFLGTYRYSVWNYPEPPYYHHVEKDGLLYTLKGQDLTVENIGWGGAIREIRLLDMNGDGYEELILGEDYWDGQESWNPTDYTWVRCWLSSSYCGNLVLYDIGQQGFGGLGASFDGLQVGYPYVGSPSVSIVGSGHFCRAYGGCSYKLASWNASTGKLEWNIIWNTGSYITGLALCNFNSDELNAICASYQNGLIEFRGRTNGSLMAISQQSHSIYHMELGNVDQDSLVKMCMASRDSLYVYKTALFRPKYRPVVSDIPNQTIAEGENFTSISLDEYVTDQDDPDSVMVWSHLGETELLVNITNRVATITVPNPEWNGAETIWFKACDPGGLCDSDQAIFTVMAVNDKPVVSDIPNQTIAEGEKFASVSLDDYITDPDDPDSVMVWSHWGETGLLVHITKRVATITVPNPEWNGVETIWFKACDPGGLCDSDQAIFTVTAVNDTPMVSDIPNQTITEGESFTSISLDDYVTDPDDPDSVMVWSYWGEAGLLIDITDRVATITVPNPKWDGVETIWFRACDPGELCDSNQATFTVDPARFYLFQNYPNPFNPQTNIRFDVPIASNVIITIYSILGEKVQKFEKRYEAGTHRLMWDGKNSSGEDVASGIYLYKLSAGSYQEIRKMVLIR
jgi:hypothetical protein